MSAALAHIAALMLIKSIAEGNDTVATLPRIAKIAAAALGLQPQADTGAQSVREAATEAHAS
ncbi:hypothetical protein BH10PSE18_BH10PSE18_07870 [soil metagenome]